MEENITDQQTSNSINEAASYEDVQRFVFDRLVEIRFIEADILELEIAQNGGDLDIDSEEGAGIAYGLEGIIGRELIGPKDLKRENFNSVKRLSDLLYKNLQETSGKGSQKSSRKRPI
jgi:hypothetical protein